MLVAEGIAAWQSIGSDKWKFAKSEEESRRLRRSLYIVKNVKKGEKVTSLNVRAIRPGYGLSPISLNQVLGKTFNKNLGAGTPMAFEHCE
jgi:N-acetylneuraminate synthase